MFKLLKTTFLPAKAVHSMEVSDEEPDRDRLTRAELARLFAAELGYLNRRVKTI